jgi:hypothetical protein
MMHAFDRNMNLIRSTLVLGKHGLRLEQKIVHVTVGHFEEDACSDIRREDNYGTDISPGIIHLINSIYAGKLWEARPPYPLTT